MQLYAGMQANRIWNRDFTSSTQRYVKRNIYFSSIGLNDFFYFQIRIDNDDVIVLDVHFQQANIVKYRTSLVFNWIDLLGFSWIK